MSFEANIRWADAFILMYSVTDKCSFDECNRLKFLINYNKRRRKLGSTYKVCFYHKIYISFVCLFFVVVFKDGILDVPVILVANKTDQYGDRMVSVEEGQRRFREISCACFHEISVRESIEQVYSVSPSDLDQLFLVLFLIRSGVFFETYVVFGVYLPNFQS